MIIPHPSINTAVGRPGTNDEMPRHFGIAEARQVPPIPYVSASLICAAAHVVVTDMVEQVANDLVHALLATVAAATVATLGLAVVTAVVAVVVPDEAEAIICNFVGLVKSPVNTAIPLLVTAVVTALAPAIVAAVPPVVGHTVSTAVVTACILLCLQLL
ncbi:hypothetical protein NDU88_000824 [Pleurodeles waltl]|uniref:Uncharacterized protein n=1 Tax=Pleurodeles waltl TaxID=8319 RepID=A0AAV7SXQ9_PLEWA|nr:hypothetical protein NDU88_000824 [Pleurodeles waltl]